MIEQLKESRGSAFGFKVIGKLTTEDVATLSQQIENVIAANKRPIGLLADLSEMHGATWAARWDEMRFLQTHTDHIARLAIICNDEWQEISEMVLVATSFMQAETVYCPSSEIVHAWHWVRMNKLDDTMPIRVMYPGKGLFQDYTPEYVGL
jgi:ABC-type phosphate transport system auxiliary subunit